MNYENLGQEELLHKIEELREKLHKSMDNLNDNELLKISRQLDDLIVISMKRDQGEN